jgi:hypothetical protein
MDRSRFGLGIALLFLFTPGLAGGAELDLEVGEISLCAAIQDRMPVGVADTFPSDIFGVYCFTRIVGAEDTTAIVHRWYHGDTKVAEVELGVKSSNWRTWSRKRMIPEWRGEWKVEVVTGDGSVIASKEFTLE